MRAKVWEEIFFYILQAINSLQESICFEASTSHFYVKLTSMPQSINRNGSLLLLNVLRLHFAK